MVQFDSVKKFKDQQYGKLRKNAQSQGKLFVDGEFPAAVSSLSSTPGMQFADVVWKRPTELCERPRLLVGGTNSDDVMQGELGCCWMVTALSCLVSFRQGWNKVVPDHKKQEWNETKPHQYQGIFRLHLWRYGQWTEVVIDDQLPMRDNKLLFTSSRDGQQFWPALVEKAYAKLLGSYEALSGGNLVQALEDLTGGVVDCLDMTGLKGTSNPVARAELFQTLQTEMSRRSLLAASIPALSGADMEAVTPSGLVKGHDYAVSAVQHVSLKGSGLFSFFNRDKIHMIRLRNPSPGKKGWNGAFSDGSREWDKITNSDRKKIGLTKDNDAEFWMSFEDFCGHFLRVDVCRLVGQSAGKAWQEGTAHGAWHKPERAGGGPQNPSFLMNPQYAVDVGQDEEEVMVQLMQKSPMGEASDAVNKTIGLTMFRVELNRKHRLKDTAHYDVIPTKPFVNARSTVTYFNDVRKGRYVIVPSTKEPSEEGQFLLRVYTTSANHFMELELAVPKKRWWNCCGKHPQVVTYLRLDKAEGLKPMDKGTACPYCVVLCEGQKVVCRVDKNTTSPVWKDAAIFYRKTPQRPVTVQVWNSNKFRDEFIGEVVLSSTAELKETSKSHVLHGRGKEADTEQPGKLFITRLQSSNIYAV